MIYILLLSLLQSAMGDLIPEPPYSYYPEDGSLPGDNVFAGALLAMSVCTCVGLACKHEPLPITITATNEDSSDGTEYFEIESNKQTKNYKQDIKKLKRDLRELQAVLSKLDRC
jgi:hypothetical protein